MSKAVSAISRAGAVVITGAGGFIGSAVVEAMLEKTDERSLRFSDGSRVEKIVAVIRPGGSRERLTRLAASPHFSIVEADIYDCAAMEILLTDIGPRVIIHTAMDSDIHLEQSEAGQRRLIDDPLAMMCRVLSGSDGGRLVTAGTCAVCAPSSSMDEEAAFDPHPGYPHYSRHKIREERVLADLSESYAVSWIHLRLFYLFGPNEAERRLLPQIVSGILQGKPVSLGPGSLVRDYAHIEDVAEAFVRSLERKETRPGGDIYNIGTGRGYSIADIACAAAQAVGDPALLRFGDLVTRDAARPEPVICNPAKAARELSWRARDNVLESIADAAGDWRRQFLEKS